MGNWLEAHESSLDCGSLSLSVLILPTPVYFAVTIELQHFTGVRSICLRFSVEKPLVVGGSLLRQRGLPGSVAIVLRAIGGAFAVYSAFIYWRKKDNALPLIRNKVSQSFVP